MGAQRTRTRTEILLRTEAETGSRNNPPFQGFDTTFPYSGVLFSTQKTVSEGHPFHQLGRTDADLGGEFFSSRCSHKHNSEFIEVKSSPVKPYTYFKGRLFPQISADLVVPVNNKVPCSPSSVEQIDAAGTTAIARTIPTNPVAGFAVTLGELHEGFPKLVGSLLFKSGLKKVLKGSGDEILNFEFAWKPLINDLLKWAHAYSHADKLWDQFLRDSGRRVRRRYTFPKTTEVLLSDVVSATPHGGGGPLTVPSLWQGGVTTFPLYREEILERNRWFSGAFTYFVDADKSQRKEWKLASRRIQYLYGTKITPQVLWNLAPWSWAADWVTNLGDIVTNFTRFSEDGLVMPYGYMMELSVRRATYRMRNVTPKGYNIPDLTQVLTQTVKYRRQATPYGFGLDEQSFTARQWAIIGALGLSRS